MQCLNLILKHLKDVIENNIYIFLNIFDYYFV